MTWDSVERRYLVTGALLVFLLTGTVFLLRLTRPTASISKHDWARTKGPQNAPVAVIEYSDFECPACAFAQGEIQSLLHAYGQKIRLAYRHFPLSGHQGAPLAHRAAECAARQDRFWAYHDRLYAGQKEWTEGGGSPMEVFLKFARDEGLDLDRFAQCLADPKIDAEVRTDQLSGSGLGVQSTPSFFVNGKLVVGIQGLRQEIEKVISE